MPTYVKLAVQKYPGKKLIHRTQDAPDVDSDDGGGAEGQDVFGTWPESPLRGLDDGDDEDDGTGDEVEGDAGRTKEQTLCRFICEGGDPNYEGDNYYESPSDFFDWWKANRGKALPKASNPVLPKTPSAV